MDKVKYMLNFENYFYFKKFIGNPAFADKNDKGKKYSKWINFNSNFTRNANAGNVNGTYPSYSNLISNLHI